MAIGRARIPRVLLLASLVVLSLFGCSRGNTALSNYASGTPDVKQLVGALERRNLDPLLEYSWVPLVRMSVLEFDHQNVLPIDKPKEYVPAPGGGGVSMPVYYTLAESKMYGPIYAVTNHHVRYYNTAWELTHVHRSHNRFWHLWGSETWTTKKNGQWEKIRKRKYLFGLFSSESPVEQSPMEKTR